MTSILRLSEGGIPDIIKNDISSFIQNLITKIEKYDKSMAEEEKDDEEDDEENNIVKKETGEADEYDEYDSFDGSDYGNFDEEYMMEQNDLNLYKGPFDLKPAPLFFRDVIGEMQSQDSSFVQSITHLISPESQSSLENIFAQCEQRMR